MINFLASECAGFVKLMGQAAEITAAGRPISKDAAQTMYGLLRQDLSHEQICAGIKKHLNSTGGRFMPTIADIRKQVGGTEEERGLLAWRFFLRVFGRWDFYESVRFPHPAYHYAIEQLGGWTRIGKEWHDLTEKEMEFRGKDFMRLYLIGERVASWHTEEGKVRVRPYLAGFHEIHNISRGFEHHAIPDVINVENGQKIERRELPSVFTEALQGGAEQIGVLGNG